MIDAIDKNDDIFRELVAIASKYGVFDCIPCAREIKAYLIAQRVRGKQIIVDTGSQDSHYGRIYNDSIDELVSTTGHHEAIAVSVNEEEMIFDNCHPNGIERALWLQNLYSPILDINRAFQIVEIDF